MHVRGGKGVQGDRGVRGSRGGRGRGQPNLTTGEPNLYDANSDNLDLCTFCSAVVDDDAVGLWFHPSQQCTGLSSEVLNIIVNEGGDAIAFICCNYRLLRNNSPSNQATTVPQEAIAQLYEMVKSLATTVSAMSNQVSSLAAAVESQKDNNNNQPIGGLNDETLFLNIMNLKSVKNVKIVL